MDNIILSKEHDEITFDDSNIYTARKNKNGSIYDLQLIIDVNISKYCDNDSVRVIEEPVNKG